MGTTGPLNEETPEPQAPETAKQRSRDIPSLDGFRAIAVLLVVVAHAGLEKWVPGGFGVTLFFFLSGFLITTLMRIEHEKTGKVSIPKFYMRRFLRIFPPLYITTTILVIAGLINLFPDLLRASGEPWRMNATGVASHYFFFTNYFTLFSDYDGAPGGGPLWSLAVEEHFYMLFPVVFASFLVRFSGKNRFQILLAFCGLVLVSRTLIAVLTHRFDWTYLATDARLDSIAFGCALALYRNPVLDKDVQEAKPPMAWFWVGVVALLACFAIRDDMFRETIRYTIQGLALMPIFTVAILRYRDFPFTWLNTSVAKWIAAFSYTIYLFHYMGFLLVEEFVTKDPIPRAILASAVILVYSWGMYALVEKPIARMRKKFA